MKFTLTETELDYIKIVVELMIVSVKQSNVERGSLKRLGRLRAKFTKNASYVVMNKDERVLLISFFRYRAEQIVTKVALGNEMEIIKSVMTKLMEGSVKKNV